ncbi:MAG: glycoside hydrolase family 99-like domain-containing protein, partial [Lachnospiraceae bacterium]|nr:glycoside hydrolase family 99-like domain-containing protein [Lachnospiraceae bacterium]
MAEIMDGNGVKIIPFYLPQFHTIPENDKWWGKGFTEWTNVRKAVPLFEGHQQPKLPLGDHFYNLLDDETKIWQAELAKQYGIFGFCYYHYWFKNGKRLLEKPAEQMLKNKDIDLPFCFCWANENWSRNWDGGNHEIIMAQEYGGKREWEMHFQYLLPFFRDKRYITMNGKPLFIIYKPEQI